MVNFLNLHKLPPIPFGKPYPLFTRISIETMKNCTRSCWFCSQEKRSQTFEAMPEPLYAKIVKELGKLEFSGVVQWFLLNEPLMDKRWEQHVSMLRKACPKATIHITSNWDTMHKRSMADQVETIHRLFQAGVNSLNLNDYDQRGYGKVVKAAAAKHAYINLQDHQNWKKLGSRKHVLSTETGPDKIHTWGGAISEDDIDLAGQPLQTGKGKCPRPMRHLVVQYDGKVPLCCAVDTTTAEVMGDVNRQSLVEIWNGKPMHEYRKRLQEGRREKQCAGCVATVAYPNAVRRVK